MEAALTTGDGARAPEYWPLLCAQVTFLVTEDPSRAQRRVRREVLSPLRFEPYEVVALASGGEVIFTKDQHIRDVATVVGDSTADLVALPLEPPVLVPGRPLVFTVDGLLRRVTVRIHGEVRSFWIRNPAGVSQGQEEGQGSLGHTRRFGQFWMVSMNDPPQTGTWEIQVTAEGNTRVRVQAQPALDFVFHFGIPVEDGPHPGLYPVTQPVAGSHLPFRQRLASPPTLGSREPGCFYPLRRVRLEHNESAWGRLWLEVPESAALDSVVTVTVAAMGREARPVPPTHAFLRLLVLGPDPQVTAPLSTAG
ncbi:Protein G7c [Myotis brandtii]|uniref:Protein G7c n=1 Tax=Myotis brandtii TaxID=109478 RepID=S7P7P5_MYOBR|nr:Protein G7c [Myotis brandtii]